MTETKKPARKPTKPIESSIATIAADAVREQVSRMETEAVVVLPRQSESIAAVNRLKEIEEELLEDSAAIVKNVMLFHTLDRDAVAPPEAWNDLYGPEEAMSRFRQVMAGWDNGANAPIGVKVATNIASSILKKPRDEGHSPTLNLRIAEMTVNLPQYPKQKVEK